MAAWQRRIQSLVRQIGIRAEQSCHQSSAFSSSSPSSRLTSSLLNGNVASSLRLWSPPSANFMRPFYLYLQHMSISSTRELSTDASEQAVPSPLTTPLLTSSGGSEETAKVVKKPETVQAVLKKIKQANTEILCAAFVARNC